MKILYLPGNHKFPYEALKWLKTKDVDIIACVLDDLNGYYSKISNFCCENKIEIISTKQLNEQIDKLDIDICFSVFYPRIIKQPVIDKCKLGCINFHPAPLPEYRGVTTMCFGVLNKIDYWEVTAHFIEDETLDTGKVITKKRIDVDVENDTPHSIDSRLYIKEMEIFKDVTVKVLSGELNKINAYNPEGTPNYYSKNNFLKNRKISIDDNSELISRKVKAFWYPKTGGVARLEIDGKEFGVIDMDIMEEIKQQYNTNN